MSNRKLWIPAAAVLWLAANLLCLSRFPTVFIDEAENANHAYNAAFHGQAVFSLYDDLYPVRIAFLRQAWPPVIRPVYIRSLAFFIKLVGFSLWKVRLFSLLVGFLCLYLVYNVGVKLGGCSMGLFAMVFLGTYFPFLYSSHSVRPECLLALNGLAVFWALLAGLETNRFSWWISSGFLAGLAPGIHTNGVALLVPVAVVLLSRRPREGSFWILTGWLMGTLLFIRLADWERFIPGYYALFFREFTTPPLLSYHGNIIRALLAETQRYFGPWIFAHWRGGPAFSRVLAVEHAALAAVLIWGLLRRAPERLAAVFAVSLALAYAVLVGQKASNYLTALAPFFALTAGGWLAQSLRVRFSGDQITETRQAVRAGVTLSGWAVFGAGAAGSLLLAGSISTYHPSMVELAGRFSRQIPPGSTVAGPQELWLGMPSDRYRDIGALVWRRMLLGETNLWAPLEEWRPGYLVIDNGMAGRWIRLTQLPHQPIMRMPTGFLPWPHEVLDIVRTGPAYGGSMVLVRVDWPKRRSP